MNDNVSDNAIWVGEGKRVRERGREGCVSTPPTYLRRSNRKCGASLRTTFSGRT